MIQNTNVSISGFLQVTWNWQKLMNLWNVIFKQFYEYQIIVQAPIIPHFKGLVMRNLEYVIRICQKIHNKVTITMSMLPIFFNQTLYEKNYLDFLLAPPPFLARCGDSSPLFELKSAIEGDSAPIVVNTTVLCPKDPLK